MIKRVKLKNFRSHLDSEFEFSEGTNVLVGILGSGKSTVMNALCFGLFGTFPDLQTRKVKLDDILMNKPSMKDSAEVVVDFSVDGKSYSVSRVIERGKGTTYSEIREGDKLLDAPNSQRVTELVERILKVNYELFSKAIYSEQNALDYFLTLPRGERMKRIDNLLTIDKFELARSSAVTLRNKLIERKLGKQSIIDQTDLEELKKNLSGLEDSLKELKESKARVSSEIQALIKNKEEIEGKLKRLEKINEDLNLMKQEEKSLLSAIEENKRAIEEIKRLTEGEEPERIRERLKDLSEKLKALGEELKEKVEEYEKLTKLISEAKARADFLEKEKLKRLNEEVSQKLEFQREFEKITKEYEKPEETLRIEKKELERAEKEFASITTKLTETEEILKRIFELKDHCPVCLSKLTEKKKERLIQELKKKIGEMSEKLSEINEKKKMKEERVKNLEQLAEKFKHLLKEIADLETLQDQLESSKKEYEELLRLIEENEKIFDEMKKDIARYQEEIEDKTKEKQNLDLIASRLDDLESIKSRLFEFESKEKKIKERIAELIEEMGEEDIKKLREDFLELTSKKSELEERMKSLENLIVEKESRKKEYEEKIKLIEAQKKDVASLEKIIKDLLIFEKALERTQVQLRTEFIEAVNYTMNELWPHLYPYGDFSAIALNIIGGDYSLQLKTRVGDWINVDGMASGGERSLACLALRIAFSLVLAPSLRMLILDEPTANLDARSITELATTLRERIGKFIDQTFLISHQKELEDAVTGRGYRIERNKEEDGISLVKPIQ